MTDTHNLDNQSGDTTQQPPTEQDRLLDNFMRDTDVPSSDRGQTPPGTQQGGQGPQATQPTTPTERGQGTQQPPQQGGTQPGQTPPVQHVPQATRTYGNLFLADGNGDIYDAQGRLLAKQGYGRSIFHKIYPYVEAAVNENTALRSRVEGYENANAVARQNGLTMEDYGAALHLMVQWKKNPVETINTLLRVAQDRGNDVTSIRGAGGGLDPAALRATVAELLTEHLKPFQPIVEQQQSAIEQRERDAAVVEQYNEFMNAFPDAAPHQLSIANVMRDHGMSEREAYFALRAYAAQNGLDWSNDLRSQLETRSQGQPQPPAGNGRTLPNMNGGRGNGTVPTVGTQPNGELDESWGSIIRRTFKQHGIDLE
jgi:hypothetical protein